MTDLPNKNLLEKEKMIIYQKRHRESGGRQKYEVKYRKENPDKIKRNQDRHEKTKKRIENKKQYKKTHQKEFKQYNLKSMNNLRVKLFELLGCICKNCGFSDKRALQFDHINGGGTKQRRELKSQTQVYRFYVKNPQLAKQQLQVLCANCNFIKEMKKRGVKK